MERCLLKNFAQTPREQSSWPFRCRVLGSRPRKFQPNTYFISKATCEIIKKMYKKILINKEKKGLGWWEIFDCLLLIWPNILLGLELFRAYQNKIIIIIIIKFIGGEGGYKHTIYYNTTVKFNSARKYKLEKLIQSTGKHSYLYCFSSFPALVIKSNIQMFGVI